MNSTRHVKPTFDTRLMSKHCPQTEFESSSRVNYRVGPTPYRDNSKIGEVVLPDICSNAELEASPSRSHWLRVCTCGPTLLLPVPWHRSHSKLSFVIFSSCHISANPSTWPSFSKRKDRVTSSESNLIK